MNKSERITRILTLLQEKRSVSVTDLAKQFGTSEMTVRRDLNEISEQYNITRTHGGAAIQSQSIIRTLSFDEKQIGRQDVKQRIAAKAVSLITRGQRIYIDAGSTTRTVVRFFDDNMQNVIVTNHLSVAEEALTYENLAVIMLGGEIVPMKRCTSGPYVEEQLKHYQLDIVFLGAAAIGSDGKLYDEFTPDANFKKSLFSVAERVILLADSSKLNNYQISSFGYLADVDTIITDSDITEEGRTLLEKYDVNIIIV